VAQHSETRPARTIGIPLFVIPIAQLPGSAVRFLAAHFFLPAGPGHYSSQKVEIEYLLTVKIEMRDRTLAGCEPLHNLDIRDMTNEIGRNVLYFGV
jgi:hypothetical protein